MNTQAHRTKTGGKQRPEPEAQHSPAEDEATNNQAGQVAANPKTEPDRHAHSQESANADGHLRSSETEMPRE